MKKKRFRPKWAATHRFSPMTRKGLDLHRVSQSDAQREGAALTEAIAETPFFSG